MSFASAKYRMFSRLVKIYALPAAIICAIPVIIAFISMVSCIRTESVYLYSGLVSETRPSIVPGQPTIDGNFGVTSEALGTRAALDVLSGTIPLWNHYEGLGSPLLGEMQSAALFPPTWLLALPKGQVLEQAILQLFAGLGTYLFFRKYGLGLRPSLMGAVLFEVNGVFAWLRNAVFNPIAFLPWMFYIIECLYIKSEAEKPFQERMPIIGLGACLGSLALYAGFPEEVYLYGLLLIGWSMFQARHLRRGAVLTLLTDLLLISGLALLLSAPLLVSFTDYLRVASIGNHGDQGFSEIWLGPESVIQYIMPYIYGPIFGSTNPIVRDVWSGTGGFIGFMPIALSIASLQIPSRRPTKLFLLAWITIALGSTQGVPGLHRAMMLIPLMQNVAVYRYINISWIFCFIFLSVIFIEDLGQVSTQSARRILRVTIGCSLLCVVLAIGAAASTLWALLSSVEHHSVSFLVSFLSIAGLVVVLWRTSSYSDVGKIATILSCATVLEAATWYACPYLSYPRNGNLDLGLVSFLRMNSGYQRVVDTDSAALIPNYGSYFGVSLLNFNDLPSPTMTEDYIHRYQIADTDMTFPPEEAPGQEGDRQDGLRSKFQVYREAGVKFVLSARDLAYWTPYRLDLSQSYDSTLAFGQHLDIDGHGEEGVASVVSALSVMTSAADQSGSSLIRATICTKDDCAEGSTSPDALNSDRRRSMKLDHALELQPGAAYTVRITSLTGAAGAVLPLYPMISGDPKAEVGGTIVMKDGLAPDIRLIDEAAKLAYVGRSMNVYELKNARSYFSADNCNLKPLSRDHVEASCSSASRLTRLEVAMQGWSAFVNGVATQMGVADGAFQTIDLPAGDTRIDFRYEPWGFKLSVTVACIALIVIVIGFCAGRHIPGFGQRRARGTSPTFDSDV